MDAKIAFCGLNCETCIVKVTIANEGDAGLERLAKEWSTPDTIIEGKDLYCNTYCTSTEGILPSYCKTCEMRNCALEKNVSNCGVCESYPCAHIEKRIPAETELRTVLDDIRSKHLAGEM